MLRGNLGLLYFLCLYVRFSVLAVDCDLALYLDGASSEFNVSGVADSQFLPNLEVTPSFPEQRAGLLGTLFFRSPGGCPATTRQLERVLSSGNFSVVAGEDLRLYPDNATMTAGGVATLNFLGLQFSYKWKNPSIGSSQNRIISNTTLRVEQGKVQFAVSESLGLDVEPGEASLVGNASKQLQEAEITLNASRVRLEIPNAAFVFETEVETGVELIPVIKASLNLAGQIVAEGFVECSEMRCGEHGRCLALENGENVCECACGWSGADCEIPSGFCDLYSETDMAVELMQSRAPPEESKDNQQKSASRNLVRECEKLFTAQQCPDTRSRYNFADQECVCMDGWSGKDCDICEAGSPCPDFYEEGAACLTNGLYDARSGQKIYECDMRSSGLSEFIGNSIKFMCNTTGPRFYDLEFQEELRNDPSISPINNTPFCNVDFAFQKTPVNCRAWGCTYEPASTKVECSTMQCECEDCGALEELINLITSVQLECEEIGDENRCVVEFGGLSAAVEAPCHIGECLLPSNPNFNAFRQDDGGFEVNWDVVTISAPMVFLGALLCLFGAPAAFLGFEIAKPVKEVAKKAEEKEPEPHRGAEISFRDLSCAVPVSMTAVPFSARLQSLLGKPAVNQALMQSGAHFTGIDTQAQSILNTANGYKSVLQGVSGTVSKGKLLGVMGPSGGGKTTFLSIISSISTDGASKRKVSGDILINGRRAGSWAKHLVAFVPQDDKLLATLTVRESLMYSAILRLPGCPMHEIKEKVHSTLVELNLEHEAHSQVGGVRNKRGISGGERRRVTIGMELVIDPNLIILDEPTSGLDSYTALNLMHTLKTICSGGRTVILSVHQATPAMLDMLDKVLLLAKGFQIYLGSPKRVAAFFERHGFRSKGEHAHTAEFMLEVVSSPETLKPLLNSIYREKAEEELGEKNVEDPGSVSDVDHAPLRKQTLGKTIYVLLWRGFLDILRNPALLMSHVAVAVVIGLFCGGIFYDADLNIEGAQNRLGVAFFVLAFLGFWSLTTVDLLHEERNIVARETSSGYYDPYIYLLSKILLDAVLLRLLPAVLLTLGLYFLMNLQQVVEKFVIFVLTVSAFNITVGLLSMAVTLLSHSPGTASLLINTILLVGLLFAGHLVNIPSMPQAVQWLHHLSPFHYAFQILVVNEMVGLRLNFEVPGYASVEGIGGDVFLRTVGIEDLNITHDLIFFAIYYGVAFVLTFVAMWLSLHLKALFHKVTSCFQSFK